MSSVCRLYYGHSAPAYVDIEINRKIDTTTPNTQHNAVGEDDSVKSVSFGTAYDLIKIKAQHMTDAKLAELKTFLTTWQGKELTYTPIWGTVTAIDVRWWDKSLKSVRHHHNNHTAIITLRAV